jgi:hypothetical protein
MIYLEKNSDVSIPKVYAAFASQEVDPFKHNEPQTTQTNLGEEKDGGEIKMTYYLVTEYIDGISLGEFMEMSKTGLLVRKVGRLLGEQLRRLRRVPAENPGLYGRLGGRAFPVMPPLWYPPAPNYDDYGPFDYETLIERLDHTARLSYAMGTLEDDFDPHIKMLYHSAKSALLDPLGPKDRQPVLTHCDVSNSNTILKVVRDQEGGISDVTELVLIDWEFMCWMPSWYEASYFCGLTDAEDWMDQSIGYETLGYMGHVNMTPAVYFAYCERQLVYRTI